MATIKFTHSSGQTTEIEAQAGWSVMEAAVDQGVQEIVAECGGGLSCATCHVYVSEPWVSQLPKPDDLENDMLGFVSSERRPESRLSCQIEVTDEMNPIELETPPNQY